MKILAITSGKGGVGKTTIALNIARQLSLAGCRTLIVDFDIHNKGTTGLFLDRLSEDSPSIINIVQTSNGFGEASLEPITSEIKLVNLDPESQLLMLPAARPQEMIQWERFLGTTPQIVEFFRRLFQHLEQSYELDAIVIDCYGGIDSLTVAAAGVADDTIIVNEPDVITFSGTLMLYRHLVRVYEQTELRPRIHFVINRITARHTYHFLEAEYGKHLAGLAIEKSILAYLPFDKLIMETFGDYPFFSELLPKCLVTRKIQLIIATLLGREAFAANFSFSKRAAWKLHRRTTELGFADPDHILRVAVTAVLWLLFPLAIMILLHLGVGGTLSFLTIRVGYQGSLIAIALILAVVGIFEPVQLSRWFLRSAQYSRRKRVLGRSGAKVSHYVNCAFDYSRAVLPAIISVFLIAPALVYFVGAFGGGDWKDVKFWPKEISGFHKNEDYSGLALHPKASVSKGSSFEGTKLVDAKLYKVKLRKVNLTGADLSGADLRSADLTESVLKEVKINDDTKFYETILEKATLDGIEWRNRDLDDLNLKFASLVGADLSGTILTQADLTNAILKNAKLAKAKLDFANLRGTDLAGADLTGAFLTGAILEGATLSYANLQEAQLDGCWLVGVNLQTADLTDAFLLGASLGKTDLRGNDTVDVENLAYAQAQGALLDGDQQRKVADWKFDTDFVQAISDYESKYREDYYVVVASHTTESRALDEVDKLQKKGYDCEVYYSDRGYYAVTIGYFERKEAEKEMERAIDEGSAPDGSYLSSGRFYKERIYPENTE